MSCAAPTIVVGGVTLSTSDFENAQEIMNTVSGDGGDPTLDEYEENIANGNNSNNRTGVQFPASTQTSLPTPSPFPASQTDDRKPADNNGNPTGCTIWDGSDYNTPLSPNFTLRQFTVNAVFPFPLTAYPGYTAQTRFCNLQNLAVNIAEPLRARFGAFSVNSGIRNKTSTSSGISQHITGQAMDVQFPGWTYARYWENAAWVKDNIPYDQFIFEHSDRTGLAWYHLSFNMSGNRSASLPTKVMTMYRNHYDPGLKRYG
jgi:hypothetical protein